MADTTPDEFGLQIATLYFSGESSNSRVDGVSRSRRTIIMRHIGQALTISAMIAALSLPLPAWAAKTLDLSMQAHAGFFSSETKQSKPIDPQVFVKDPAAPAATGPQNIKHEAGLRPAFVKQDKGSTPVFTADGKALNLTLGRWLGAKGRAIVSDKPDGTAEINASFSHLIPNGEYSLFENHFDQQPIGFTPLDGSGEHNSFVATKNGTAKISVKSPSIPTHANAILLVYHSDGQTHGGDRGPIGVTAHHQLIARPK